MSEPTCTGQGAAEVAGGAQPELPLRGEGRGTREGRWSAAVGITGIGLSAGGSPAPTNPRVLCSPALPILGWAERVNVSPLKINYFWRQLF